MTDAIVHGREIKWNAARGRYILADEKEKDDDDVADAGMGMGEGDAGKKETARKTGVQPRTPKIIKPTKPNPLHLSLYGTLCTVAKSYQSGICEWFLLFLYSEADGWE